MNLALLICVHSKDNEHDALFHRALRSVQAQTFKDFDIHIVFDECWSITEAMVDVFFDIPSFRYYKHVKDKKTKLADAKNFGLSKINTSHVAFLDADDQMLGTKLEKQWDFIQKNPQVDVLGTQAFDLYPDGRLTENCFRVGDYNKHIQIVEELPRQNCLCHGSLMLNKTMLDSVGGYCDQEEFRGYEDWATWIKLMHHGAQFYVLPERLYVYSMGTSVNR